MADRLVEQDFLDMIAEFVNSKSRPFYKEDVIFHCIEISQQKGLYNEKEHYDDIVETVNRALNELNKKAYLSLCGNRYTIKKRLGKTPIYLLPKNWNKKYTIGPNLWNYLFNTTQKKEISGGTSTTPPSETKNHHKAFKQYHDMKKQRIREKDDFTL